MRERKRKREGSKRGERERRERGIGRRARLRGRSGEERREGIEGERTKGIPSYAISCPSFHIKTTVPRRVRALVLHTNVFLHVQYCNCFM